MGLSFLIVPLLITVLVILGISLFLTFFNFRAIRLFSQKYEEDIENYKTTVNDFEEDFTISPDDEIEEDDEIEKEHTREEVKLEIDKDMERLTNEIRKNELLMEKMEKHYSTLRKVSKDMMESIIPPTKFQSFSDTYAPIPLIDEKPLWNDLVRNHIPSDQGNLYEMWGKYVELTAKYSHQKVESIKGILDKIFGRTEYRRLDQSDINNSGETYYAAKPVLHILNNLFFNEPEIQFLLEDGKKEKKLGRSSTLLVNNEEFIHGKTSEVMAFQSMFREILDTKNYSICKETQKQKELKSEIDDIIKNIKKLLNWFIFEEDNMIQCKMLE